MHANGKSVACPTRSAESATQRSCSSPLQHALYVIRPGCPLAPVRDSHSLGATVSAQSRQALSLSLVSRQHRSALRQTYVAATSHHVDAVRDALSRGGLDVALASASLGHWTPG